MTLRNYLMKGGIRLDKSNIDREDLTKYILLVLYIADRFDGHLYNVILSEVIYLVNCVFYRKLERTELKYSYKKVDLSPKYEYEDQYLNIMQEIKLIRYEVDETGSYIIPLKKIPESDYNTTMIEYMNKVIDFYNRSSFKRKDELILEIMAEYGENEELEFCTLSELEGII